MSERTKKPTASSADGFVGGSTDGTSSGSTLPRGLAAPVVAAPGDAAQQAAFAAAISLAAEHVAAATASQLDMTANPPAHVVGATSPSAGTASSAAGGASRKDKSLALLADNFLKLYGSLSEVDLSLDQLCAQIGVERRRMYDIINVLEALFLVSKVRKNVYTWHGLSAMERAFIAMRYGLNPLDKDTQVDLQNCRAWSTNPDAMEKAASTTSLVEAQFSRGAREKSLSFLTQQFICMFMACGMQKLGLEILLEHMGPESTVGSGAFPQTSDSRDEDAGLPTAADSTVAADSAGSPLEMEDARNRTRLRRLYDIANILTSLGLVEKGYVADNSMKPAFIWKANPKLVEVPSPVLRQMFVPGSRILPSAVLGNTASLHQQQQTVNPFTIGLAAAVAAASAAAAGAQPGSNLTGVPQSISIATANALTSALQNPTSAAAITAALAAAAAEQMAAAAAAAAATTTAAIVPSSIQPVSVESAFDSSADLQNGDYPRRPAKRARTGTTELVDDEGAAGPLKPLLQTDASRGWDGTDLSSSGTGPSEVAAEPLLNTLIFPEDIHRLLQASGFPMLNTRIGPAETLQLINDWVRSKVVIYNELLKNSNAPVAAVPASR